MMLRYYSRQVMYQIDVVGTLFAEVLGLFVVASVETIFFYDLTCTLLAVWKMKG